MSGMRSKDAGAFVRHLQRDETSRCFFSFCVASPHNEDTKDQMLRLLASAVYVPPQMCDVHQVSWHHMPRPELHEGHGNFALNSITVDGQDVQTFACTRCKYVRCMGMQADGPRCGRGRPRNARVQTARVRHQGYTCGRCETRGSRRTTSHLSPFNICLCRRTIWTV